MTVFLFLMYFTASCTYYIYFSKCASLFGCYLAIVMAMPLPSNLSKIFSCACTDVCRFAIVSFFVHCLQIFLYVDLGKNKTNY